MTLSMLQLLSCPHLLTSQRQCPCLAGLTAAEYVQSLARSRQQEEDCEEDMDTDVPESTGCSNWDIMAALGHVDTVECRFWARETSTDWWDRIVLQVSTNDITLLRLTQKDKDRMLHEFDQNPGPFAAMCCAAMIPVHLLLALGGQVSYCGGRNKAALPRNLQQRLSEYLQESFMEMSMESSRSIPRHVNRLFQWLYWS
ncbi:uncharacterized protein LOC128825970 isoform X2 [Malaclemys terrapin pileata]|uniref:uncharacterized protein LOC128825970 isoform X2 n=1 Tax=Malaclemys terrapin pileata TaxID=2991368 RepID=UPI0023A8DD3A|nr:uncharacterized protein LOC128825970 isoform X2 [Malaclemys terrapin pileata]